MHKFSATDKILLSKEPTEQNHTQQNPVSTSINPNRRFAEDEWLIHFAERLIHFFESAFHFGRIGGRFFPCGKRLC